MHSVRAMITFHYDKHKSIMLQMSTLQKKKQKYQVMFPQLEEQKHQSIPNNS